MIKPAGTIIDDRVAEAFDPTPARSTHRETAKPAKSRARRLARLMFAIFGVAVLAAVNTLAMRLLPASLAPLTEARPSAIFGLGFIEPSSTVIRIGAPGSPDALPTGASKVVEGDDVQAGQVLAGLDTVDKLAAQVEASKAQLRLKRVILEKQQVEIAATITSRRSTLEQATIRAFNGRILTIHARPGERIGSDGVLEMGATWNMRALILADEPTAMLDKATGRQIVDLLQDLAKTQGSAILVVTHDNRILDIADRIIEMEDGGIIRAGRASQ